MYIKNIASTRAASQSDSDEYVRIPRRKKAKTGFLNSNKSPRRAYDKQHGAQRYCVLCKKVEMPEQKCALNSDEDFTSVCTKRSIKDGIVGPIGSRNHAVQQHKKYEKNKEGSEIPQDAKQDAI